MGSWGKGSITLCFIDLLPLPRWQVGDVCITSGLIKEKRLPDSHSTTAEKGTITLELMLSWAVLETEAADDCKDFVRLVASFGLPGSPLIMDEDIVAIVDNFKAFAT